MKKLIAIFTVIAAEFSPLMGANIKSYSDEQVIASTLYFEARGENMAGKMAVASVIYNRAQEKRWKKLGLGGVCLQRLQFSCFNNGFKMPNPTNSYDKAALIECQKIAKQIVSGTFKPTVSANHYVTTNFYKKAKTSHWCKKMMNMIVVDNHVFGRA